jgi:hypothetical protein
VGIPFSSLPPELQEKILGRKAHPKRQKPEIAPPAAPSQVISRSCPCGSMVLRPDGIYTEPCPGCGKPLPTPTN